MYFFENEKPRLVKKDSESQLMCSLDKLKTKGIDAYLVINLLTLEILSYNYIEIPFDKSKCNFLNEPYTILVKSKDKIFFHSVGGRPYYDEVVLLSCGDFIMINRYEKTFLRNLK